MGSTPGKMGYEFKNKGCKVEKAVATEVEAVSSEELEKSVAEDLKTVDPVDAEEVLRAAAAEAKAKADAEAKATAEATADAAAKAKAKAKTEADVAKAKAKAKELEEKEKAKAKENTDGGTEDSTVPKENSDEPKSEV